MSALPIVRRVYIGSVGIEPEYLAGRRMIVAQVLTRNEVRRGNGERPLKDGGDEVLAIAVRSIVRGRVKDDIVWFEDWHARAVR